MRSFFAVLWPAGDEPPIVAAARSVVGNAQMVPLLKTRGLFVATRNLEAFPFAPQGASRGCVIGDIHYRHGPADAFDGSPTEIERIAGIFRSGAVSEQCWGSFLAFHSRSDDEPFDVRLSPFASLCAYYLVAQSALFIASDARFLANIAALRPAIDWDSVGCQLRFDNVSLRNTCLHGVQELRSGEVLRWENANAIITPSWNPWAYTDPDLSLAEDEPALELLERELLRCVATRTHGLENPLLDLSGGLDSSILAALSLRGGITPIAVNVFSTGTEGDERDYARSVASHLGIALAERSPQAEMVDVQRCASPQLPRPHARSFVQEIDRLTLTEAPGAAAFINGGGGDAAFCHLQSSGPAADVLYSHAASASFLRTVHQVADAAQCSFWLALRKTLAKAARRPRSIKLVETSTFLARDAGREPAHDQLPWPSPPPKSTLPGKLEHVRGIYSSLFNINGFARTSHLKAVFPLLSQPLLETCLRIPTWMMLGQGHDRYLARRAAQKWLPGAVAWRRSKGGLGQLQRDIFRLNREVMREMLLDGELQKHGLVERGELEAHLRNGSELSSDRFPRLLRLCDLEAWARHWT